MSNPYKVYYTQEPALFVFSLVSEVTGRTADKRVMFHPQCSVLINCTSQHSSCDGT